MRLNRLIPSKIKAPLRLHVNRLKAVGANGIRWAYYEGIYARRILRTKPMACGANGRFELHTLSCEKDVLNTLWALKTFLYYGGVRPKVIICDDGSLTKHATDLFLKHLANRRIISRNRFYRDMDNFLKAYPQSLAFSKKPRFYCAIKLFGPML